MPSTSEAQARFMAICAHTKPRPARCPPVSVSKEFNRADAGGALLSGIRKHKPRKK